MTEVDYMCLPVKITPKDMLTPGRPARDSFAINECTAVNNRLASE